MKSFARILVALVCVPALFVAAAGCSPENIDAAGTGGGVVPGPGAGTPSTITVNFTDIPTGAAITSIALSGSFNVNAVVRDSSTNPVSGVVVNFTVSNAASGTFTTTSATTNASGIATVRFNANPGSPPTGWAVSFTASTILTTGTTINSAPTSFTIGSPPAPIPTNATLTISPLSINIQGQATVTVTAVDSSGAPAYNTNIDLDLSAGAALGSFSATDPLLDLVSLTTNAAGQVTATFYAGGSSGTVTIRATATAATPVFSKTGSISITSLPNSVNVIISPVSVTNLGTAQIEAEVLNVLSSAVPDGTLVTFSCIACPAGIGTFATTAATAGGFARVTFTAGATQTGTAVIQASAGTTPNVVSGTAQITVDPATTSGIQFVSASPAVIGILGSGTTDTSIVTFKVTDSNGNGKASVLVNFLLYGPTGAYIGSTPGTITLQGSTAADGNVVVILHSGLVAGPARIVATVNGTTISTSSGNISVGGGVPSHKNFDLAASRFNLEGFAYNNIQSTITAYLADRFGNYNVLQGTSVSFVTEAGAIDTSNATDANGLTSVIFRTQDPRPVDVAPLVTEVRYTSGGRTYNPRDGWVTILAMTTGEETFFDANANGFYDTGDTFTDIGEPFIDSDDSASRSAGELFFDWPSSGASAVPGAVAGSYQTGNSQWDGKIPIWKTITLVFTGPPHIGSTASGILTSRIECTDPTIAPLLYGNVTIPKGQSRTFMVYVSDINMNTLIGGTTIEVKSFTGAKGSIAAPTPFIVVDRLSDGPTIFTVRLLNAITDATNQSGDFYVEITWPGGGGTTKTMVYYPGAITLTPTP